MAWPRKSFQDGFRVLLAQEDWIGEETKLHLLEAISCQHMAGVFRVFRHSEVVVELDTYSAFGLQLLVVEAINLGMCLDNVVNAFEIECIKKRLIKSDPNRNTICVM